MNIMEQNFSLEYANSIRPSRFRDTDYPVILEGWSENEIAKGRIGAMDLHLKGECGIIEWMGKFSFPLVAWMVGLNCYGEPLVCPYYPATTLCPLSFFKWRLA